MTKTVKIVAILFMILYIVGFYPIIFLSNFVWSGVLLLLAGACAIVIGYIFEKRHEMGRASFFIFTICFIIISVTPQFFYEIFVIAEGYQVFSDNIIFSCQGRAILSSIILALILGAMLCGYLRYKKKLVKILLPIVSFIIVMLSIMMPQSIAMSTCQKNNVDLLKNNQQEFKKVICKDETNVYYYVPMSKNNEGVWFVSTTREPWVPVGKVNSNEEVLVSEDQIYIDDASYVYVITSLTSGYIQESYIHKY